MRRIRTLVVMVLALALAGCAGYRQASTTDAPFSLPEAARSLFLTKVENPTMDPDLESVLRAEIRDEFTRRGRIEWVERDEATAYLKLKVNRFRTATSLTDGDEETIKSSASINIEAWITEKESGKELWHGAANHSESFLTDQEGAEADVLEMAARKLADRLSPAY